MKRFLCVFLCVFLLFSAWCAPDLTASAEESGSRIVSAYLVGDTLHAFFPAELAELDNLKASTEEYRGYTLQPEPFYRSGGTSYVVLVDSSLSMKQSLKKQKEQLAAFFEELLDDNQLKPNVILIPFSENIDTDALLDSSTFETSEDFLAAVNKLQYADSDTAIYTSLVSAVEWIDKNFPVGEKGLVNLILLCDENEKVDNRGKAEEKLSDCPEILFHSVVKDKGWVNGLHGKGVCTDFLSGTDLASAAKQIKEMIHSLARVDLSLKQVDPEAERITAEFYLRRGSGSGAAYSKQTIGNVPVLTREGEEGTLHVRGIESSSKDEQNKAPADETAGATPPPSAEGETDPAASPSAEGDPDQAPNPSENPDSGTEANPGSEDTQEGEDNPGGTESPTPSTEPDPGTVPEEGSEGENDSSKAGERGKIWLFVGIAGLVLLAAAVFFAVRAGRNRARGNGLNMKLEIISGNCKTRRRSFALRDELLIGRDRDCDICFADPEVSGKNTRIFFQENLIMIEDLDSTNGTTIQGIRIFAPNRLRSGDQIGIGPVQFLLRF